MRGARLAGVKVSSILPSMVLSPEQTVFMLDMDGVLDTATMKAIQDGGHSRIPIYHKTRNTIVGMILVKDLLLMVPPHPIS